MPVYSAGHPFPTKYLFVDGNYFELAFRNIMSDFFGDSGDIDFDRLRRLSGIAPQRIYYYHSLDDEQRVGETDGDFKKRVDAELERFDRINALNGYHVRLGSVTGSRVKRRRQKQVDVWLAVEMLTHAYSHNMDEAFLLAGDLDFKPVVDAVVNLGIQTRVVCELKSAARDLYRAADIVIPLDVRVCHELSAEAYRKTHTLPQAVGNEDFITTLAGSSVLKTGTFQGRAAKLVAKDGWYHVLVDPGDGAYSLRVSDENQIRAEKYLEMVHSAKVNWS